MIAPQHDQQNRPQRPVFLRLSQFFSVLVVVLFLPITALAQTSDQLRDETATSPQQQVEIAPTAPDAAIAQRLDNILDATGWYRDVSVEVNEGVVFLDGTAQTEANQEWARDLAVQTTGVVAVVNRITVDEGRLWSFEPALAEIENLLQDAIAVLPLILLAFLILPIAWYTARLVSGLAKRALRNRVRSPFLRTVVARAIAFPVFLLGLYIVLQVAGLTQLALSIVGGAGVLGIVIGFAFRDIAENFLSSLILSVRRPFRRGDFIKVAGLSGTVSSMSTRSTLLTSIDGNQIHVPNSTIFKNVIENFTSSPNRRGDFVVGIGYDAGIAEAQQVILDTLTAHLAVLAAPEPMVLVDELGASTVNIKTYYWFDGHMISPIKLKSALLRAVKSELTAKGISMPDEAREVIFPEGVRVFGAQGDDKPHTALPVPDVARTAPEPQVSASEGDLLAENPVPTDDLAQEADEDLLGSS